MQKFIISIDETIVDKLRKYLGEEENLSTICNNALKERLIELEFAVKKVQAG